VASLSNGQIGGAGLGATAGGSLLSAGGSIASGFANKSMYDYQASIAQLNQQIDNQNAEFARQTGEQQSLQSGLRSGQQLGQIKVGEAASGFDVRSGSNAQVQASQKQIAMLDQNQIRSNAARTAYNYQLQGTVAGAQASLYQMAGNNSVTAGVVGAGSSILGGAASVSSEWLQGSKVGLWGAGGSTSASGDDQLYGAA
jgi:hypothetical protein